MAYKSLAERKELENAVYPLSVILPSERRLYRVAKDLDYFKLLRQYFNFNFRIFSESQFVFVCPNCKGNLSLWLHSKDWAKYFCECRVQHSQGDTFINLICLILEKEYKHLSTGLEILRAVEKFKKNVGPPLKFEIPEHSRKRQSSKQKK